MAVANKFRGRAGRLMVAASSSVAAADVGALRNYQVTLTAGAIDFSDFDSSGWTDTMSGQRAWSMSAEAVFLSTAATSQQDELRTAALAGSTKYFVVHTSTAASGAEFSGWGWVSNFNISGDMEGVALTGFEITGSQALTESS
jgi:hypothetical protein